MERWKTTLNWAKPAFAALAFTLGAALHGHAAAAAPGAWEMEVAMKVNGADQKPAKQTVCIDAQWFKAHPFDKPGPMIPIAEAVSCSDSRPRVDGANASWERECKLRENGWMKMQEGSITSEKRIETYSNMQAQMGSQKRSMQRRALMRWISDKCPPDAQILK